MSNPVISLIALLFYLATGLLLALRLSGKAASRKIDKRKILAMGLAGVTLHAAWLYHKLFTLHGVNIGFFNALSLLSWLIALLLLITAIKKPVENLGIAVFPLAALAILLESFYPSHHILEGANQTPLELHIMLSIVAYSFLSIAALQAILLAVQEKHLHNKHPGGFVRVLPPLQTMESILFQLLGLGFILQSLSLISGFVFLEDMFAQHLVHKTVLSIIAWLVFATLLWGRWRFGWRGKTAIRWTLSGFISLLLAYLGSKLVLEIILGR